MPSLFSTSELTRSYITLTLELVLILLSEIPYRSQVKTRRVQNNGLVITWYSQDRWIKQLALIMQLATELDIMMKNQLEYIASVI